MKDYLLKGYVVNQRITTLEHQVADLTEKVNFFVRSSLPPIEGIFYDGQIFDAYAHIISLIKQAKTSIILIDNYIDVDTLTMRMSAASILHSSCCVDITLNAILNHSSYEDD